MKYSKAILTSLLLVIMCSNMGVEGTFAKIPEPDNILYGIPPEDTAVVRLKIEGQVICSYVMGSDPAAGLFYVLKVPIDAMDPQTPGTARPGDAAELYLNSDLTPVATIEIEKRGTIRKIHLDTTDADADGLTRPEELELKTNPYNADSDGDGINDGQETSGGTKALVYDSDGDGYSDGYEIAAGTDPLDENAIPAIYVDKGNTSGTEDGSIEYPFDTIGEGVAVAPDKFTVLVAAGVYEEALNINKNVRLVGKSPTTTTIDAGGAATAIHCSASMQGTYGSIEKFRILNADVGIDCVDGASPLIRNNVVTNVSSFGVLCSDNSKARIINNTISDNELAAGIKTTSGLVEIVNNIVSENYIGIDCGTGNTPRLDFNNVWNNLTSDYYNCFLGYFDMSADPKFVDKSYGDFRLKNGSECIDAGDSYEFLSEDYSGGSSIAVNEVTNTATGDRIWITDGRNMETDIVTGTTTTTVDIQGEFMHEYLASKGAYIFTSMSDSQYEPETTRSRIDMGAYGNTPEAGGIEIPCYGDSNEDGDTDGLDLANFMGTGDLTGLADFASSFGRTDCSQPER